jgi:enoyl-CoA hydratase
MPSATVVLNGRIAILTIDSARGPLDAALREQFADAVHAIANNDDVRVVVVAGANAAFGGGIERIPEGLEAAGAASVIASLNKPTIAWIDGTCLDMGLELALACDVRFASSTSTFGMTSVQRASLPWDGGTQRLARAVGRGHALRLLLTGEVIGADEALRIGLVEGISDMQTAIEWAERAAAGAPIASAYTKEAIASAGDMTLRQGLGLEADLSVLLQSTGDRAEGMDAFATKRPPEFEGR